MSYQILLTDGTVFATIQDGTINNSSSVTLVGKNYAGYGAFLDTNFIHLLENGSNTIPPINPLVGQLWWDQTNGILQVFNGIDFKSLGGATASPTAPTNNVIGDLWYDTVNEELNVYTGTEYIVVGPSITNGTGTKATTIVDNVSVTHYVVEILVQNNVVAIISKDAPFVPAIDIPGFIQVFPGITIAESIGNVDQFFNGTSTNTIALEGRGISDFILTSGGAINGSLTISNSLAVGPSNDLSIGINGSTATITNTDVNGNIVFTVNQNTVLSNAVSIIGSNGNLEAANIVSDTISAGNVIAVDFYGDGGHLSNISGANIIGGYSNANVAAYLPINTSNVSANYFFGNGSFLSNINAANIVSNYSNANVAAYLPIYSGNINANNVTFTGTAVMNSQTVTSGTISAAPVNPTDIANKNYVDSVAQGLDPKDACFCVSTTNITLSGLLTIDGYTLLNTNRVLVTGQTASQDNGIYIAAAGAWSRAPDMTTWNDCPGAYTLITQGTQYQGTGWVCTAPAVGTINVTPMPWVQFHAAGTNTYTAGYGLALSGTQFSIAPSYAAVPPAWGTTTPNTGAFTSLTSNGSSVVVNDGGQYGINISGTASNANTATYATSAGSANTASTANFATTAGSATSATTATTAGAATNPQFFATNYGGGEADIGVASNGVNSAYLYNNTNAWGLYSADVGGLSFARGTNTVTLSASGGPANVNATQFNFNGSVVARGDGGTYNMNITGNAGSTTTAQQLASGGATLIWDGTYWNTPQNTYTGGVIACGNNISFAGNLLMNSGTIFNFPNIPTGSGTPVYYNFTNARMQATTSTLKNKTNIYDLRYGLNEVLKLRPVTFTYKPELYEAQDIDPDTKQYAGFIAEEVKDIGLDEYVALDSNNEPISVDYANMVSLLTNAIKELNAKIESLTAEVEILKKK